MEPGSNSGQKTRRIEKAIGRVVCTSGNVGQHARRKSPYVGRGQGFYVDACRPHGSNARTKMLKTLRSRKNLKRSLATESEVQALLEIMKDLGAFQA
jgi:hypothetical protein